jgi:mono/diheme cytochrome c family protein
MRLRTIALITFALCAALNARASDEATANGAALFTQNCLMCHQSGATGLPGQFPRLAGRIAKISSTPAGRAYLIDVLTYGMVGTLAIDGDSILGLMPPFAQLPDAQVADILSYVQTLGEAPAKPPAPFTAAEFHARRATPPKSAADVFAERQTLQHAKLIP